MLICESPQFDLLAVALILDMKQSGRLDLNNQLSSVLGKGHSDSGKNIYFFPDNQEAFCQLCTVFALLLIQIVIIVMETFCL